MNIGNKYDEKCILCDHKLDVHKIYVFTYLEKEDIPSIGYRIRCYNEVEGHYHCQCYAGFEDVIYNINITKMENNKK
jgi:hypothetical protein